MPWSNQSGGGSGGGWRGGNGGGGGPWGQGPSNGNGGGGRPGGGPGNQPDLEDIIRRGQERLRGSVPGGVGGGLMALLIAGGIGLFWLFFLALYQVDADELGVELVFGQPKEELSLPGLHFHWWPIETVEKARIVENQINIGERRSARGASTGLMLSGDQNIVDLTFSVIWRVSVPKEYLFNVREPEDMVRQVAESAMREVVGRRPAQDVFRDDREGVAFEVREIIQTTLDSYQSGIVINTVNIEDVAPPPEVADSFEEVQRAEQDEDRFREEANRDSNQLLGAARGEAAQIREEAAAYKNRVVQEAEGEAQRFISVYNEYARARDVTRQRLYIETMERLLTGTNKVIVEQGQNAQGVVPYLPLPELQRRSQQGGN